MVVGGTAGIDLAVAEAAAREGADAVVPWRRRAAVYGALPVRGDRAPALEPAPIRVDVVSPGVVRTELWRELPEADREDLFASAAQSLPVGQGGEPEDVAEAYLYLMRGRYGTGSTVVVDGGAVLVRPRGIPRPAPRLSPR